MDHGAPAFELPIAWALALTAFFVALNGFFVAAEFALVKVRAARIEAQSRRGKRAAAVVGRMLGRMDLYLSACQLGITLASLVLGWLAEPAVASLLLAAAERAGLAVGDSGALHFVALAIALGTVTVLHMTIGEQAPKILAIQQAEAVSMVVARPLWIFTAVFRPFIWIINALSNALLRLAGVTAGLEHDGVHDLEELRAVLAASTRAGHLSPRQRAIGENVLSLVELQVRHVMVPRLDLVVLSTERGAEENLALVRDSGHTRFAWGDPDLDSVRGLVHAKDLLRVLLAGEQPDLSAMLRELHTVPDSQPLSRLIFDLQRRQAHCALVVDEHGTALGMIFLEDALEEIVGPLNDEFDEQVSGWVRLSPGVLELAGSLPKPEAAALLGLELGSDEDTIAGVVLSRLGRLPRQGDQVDIPPHRLTVLAVARRRIVRLRVEAMDVADEAPTDPGL